MHVRQVGNNKPVFPLRLFPREDITDQVVRKPGLGADDGRVQAALPDFSGPADAHVAYHGETVRIRFQGAEIVGQEFGQHRDDPAGEID